MGSGLRTLTELSTLIGWPCDGKPSLRDRKRFGTSICLSQPFLIFQVSSSVFCQVSYLNQEPKTETSLVQVNTLSIVVAMALFLRDLNHSWIEKALSHRCAWPRSRAKQKAEAVSLLCFLRCFSIGCSQIVSRV